MADSFALGQSGQVVIQQDTAAASGPATSLEGGPAGNAQRVGGVGGGGGDFGAIAKMSMQTIEALNKLTEGAVKPVIDRMEKQQYFEGMSKVVQGQTLQQVEQDDPWYMNLAGPSATVRGAQAMTATTALQQAETNFYGDMPELRKKSPDEMRSYLVDQATSIGSTGDPLVDATVQAKLAESWGPMLSTHMKEHLAWQQENMVDHYVNSNVTQGAHLQAVPRPGSPGYDPKVAADAAATAVEQAAPMPGQSRDSWNKATGNAIRANLEAGHFAWWETIKQSPVFANLDPKLREDLIEKEKMYLEKDKLTNPLATGYMQEAGAFQAHVDYGAAGGIKSLEQLYKSMDDQNEAYARATGASTKDAPFYDNKARADATTRWLKATAENEKASRVLVDKNAALADKVRVSSVLATQVVNGADPALLHQEGISEDSVRDTYNQMFLRSQQDPNPNASSTMFGKLAQTSGDKLTRPTELTRRLDSGVNAFLGGVGDVSPASKEALTYAASLYAAPNGAGWSALVDYLGADRAASVAAVLDSGVALDDQKGMDTLREIERGKKMPVTSPMTQADRESLRSEVAKMSPGWFRKIVPIGDQRLGAYKLNPESISTLADIAAPDAWALSKAKGIPVSQALDAVMSIKMNGADLIGGAVIMKKAKTEGDMSLHSAVTSGMGAAVNQGQDNYQEAVRNVISHTLTANAAKGGGEMANFNADDWIVRSGDQLGQGVLNLTLTPKGNDYRPTHIRIAPGDVIAEIRRLDAEKNELKRKYATENADFIPNSVRSLAR